MLGINQVGNFSAATSLAAVDDLEQLVSGVGQLASANRVADLIVVNPTDGYRLLISRAAGSGEYNMPSVVRTTETGTMSVVGVPVVMTNAQTVGTYTILDRNGLLIGVAEQLNVRFFEEDGTNVRENKVTARIESAIALACFGASYVVKGTF